MRQDDFILDDTAHLIEPLQDKTSWSQSLEVGHLHLVTSPLFMESLNWFTHSTGLSFHEIFIHLQ